MKPLFFCIIMALSISLKSQNNFQFSIGASYIPSSFIIGDNDDLFNLLESNDALNQSPLLSVGGTYNWQINKRLALIVGLSYAYSQTNSENYDVASTFQGQTNSVRSNERAVRNYLIPKIGVKRSFELKGGNQFSYELNLTFGLPFNSYDRLRWPGVPGIDPFYGFVFSDGDDRYVNRYGGEEFKDGLLYGGEINCYYHIKPQNQVSLFVGPSLQLLKLQSAADMKYAIGLKLGLSLLH